MVAKLKQFIRLCFNKLDYWFPLIQFEFGRTSIDSRTFFIDHWNFFQGIGYFVCRIAPSGVRKIEQYSEKSEVFRQMNFIASKNDAQNFDD